MSETKEKKVDMTQSRSGSTREIKNAFPSSNFKMHFHGFPWILKMHFQLSKMHFQEFPKLLEMHFQLSHEFSTILEMDF